MNNNPHREGPPMKRSLVGSILLAIALVAVATARGQVPVRTEILPIESVTLSEKDFLTGVTTGSAAKIAGELRVPRTNTRAPAVILMHGSSGIRTNAFRWSDELLRLGVAVFIVDSFGGRGISNTGTDQSQLNTVAMTVEGRVRGPLLQSSSISALFTDPGRSCSRRTSRFTRHANVALSAGRT
jgi:hypothetical protein